MGIPANSIERIDELGRAVYIHTPLSSIVIIQTIFESYEGVGLVRTIDRDNSILSILTTKDMLETVEAVLSDLAKTIPLRYLENITDAKRQEYKELL